MKKLISIVIPAYNEEAGLKELGSRLEKVITTITTYSFEVIIVENGSEDNTIGELYKLKKKHEWIKIVQLVKNVGTDGALIAGLTFAKGEAAIVIMADLQEDPALIPQFIKKWEEGYEIVYGIVKKRKDVNNLRTLQTFLYYKVIKLLTNNLVVENASDFRLMDKAVYKLITLLPEHDKFFRGLVNWTGFKQTGIVFDRSPRFAGESKAYLTTVIRVGLNGIFSFSSAPVSVPFVFSGISFLFSLIFLFLHQRFNALVCFLFSLLFFVLTIIIAYLQRLLVEARNRPQFIIRKKIGV